MQFTESFVGGPMMWGGALLMGALLLVALYFAPWQALRSVVIRQHALWGSLAALCLVWSFRFEVIPGLFFHPFLMVTITLMFGWSLALILGAIVLVILAVVAVDPLSGHWSTLPWDWLFTTLIPATMAYGLLRLMDLFPTRNLFVYILGQGFFGAIGVTLVSCALLLLFVWGTQPEPVFEKLWDKAAFVLPLMYAEGFLNGMLVTSITVFLPDLVKTFDDERFLKSG
ncbi:MAG: energy-coupling factor ABC transporter permease [Ketobacter sp.]|mgnify:CR=1 FL=1|uniref:energy-coupling factor ABC transporter permease n=1 Tax=Ketobacter sp. MCCC 1A13808 TaxID=2602738 RepID=UPI0018DD0436|nr:energy-coupling factor ABC transporter permease [Ketobacter sp. MCCC 1A13808]